MADAAGDEIAEETGEAVAALDSAAENAEEATEEAAEDVAQAADAAGDEIAEETAEAGEAIENTVENAAAATANAVDAAADEAEEGANELREGDLITTTEAGEAAQEALDFDEIDAATAQANAGTDEEGLEALLSVEGFDMARVMDIIQGAGLNDLQKTTLEAALEQAQNSPEALEEVLAQLRGALDL